MSPENAVSNGDASFPPETDMMQVVDYDENFNDHLERFLTTQGISPQGFDYHVASILGPQSSGKSTLLNLLFGTKFSTMDETSGRYQVTQGVWLGVDPSTNILVMDLEGTDSRERGENSVNFERKIALFALALSEVLIVNVWAQDVGRYNAANLDLLKTVMELDLQLFFGAAPPSPTTSVPVDMSHRMHKTRLLFVLRDHVSSPFETLCKTLRADVENIWNTIEKPEAAQGVELTEFFDIDFYSLPHKVLMEQEFFQKGSELRRRFKDGEVFLPEYQSGIAADGFPSYASSVWETIRANRELDIPSQKEMLAHVRCEQLARDALAIVDLDISPLNEQLLEGVPTIVPGLMATLLEICETALQSYRNSAHRYSESVADVKDADLCARITAEMKPLVDEQVSLAADQSILPFRKRLLGADEPSERNRPWKDWAAKSKMTKEEAVAAFVAACDVEPLRSIKGAELEHPMAFVEGMLSSERKRVVARLSAELERTSSEVRVVSMRHCQKMFRGSFKPAAASAVEAAGADVWGRVSEVASVSWEATAREASVVLGGEGLGLSDEEMESVVEDELKPSCHEVALTDINDLMGSVSGVMMRMMKHFDDNFRFDERGVPRHFGPTDDIETMFMTARGKAEEILELFDEVRLTGPLTELRQDSRDISETGTTRLLNSTEKSDLRDKLKRQTGAIFLEAKRAQEAARITTKTPGWIFLLLLFLGWNEMMAVLRSPLLLMLTVIVAPVLYVGFMMDAPTLLGPAIGATVGPIVEQARTKLAEILAPNGVAQPTAVAAAGHAAGHAAGPSPGYSALPSSSGSTLVSDASLSQSGSLGASGSSVSIGGNQNATGT